MIYIITYTLNSFNPFTCSDRFISRSCFYFSRFVLQQFPPEEMQSDHLFKFRTSCPALSFKYNSIYILIIYNNIIISIYFSLSLFKLCTAPPGPVKARQTSPSNSRRLGADRANPTAVLLSKFSLIYNT